MTTFSETKEIAGLDFYGAFCEEDGNRVWVVKHSKGLSFRAVLTPAQAKEIACELIVLAELAELAEKVEAEGKREEVAA